MIKERYYIPIRWFRTDYCPPSKVVARLYPNYKEPTYKGKHVFGWTITWYTVKSLKAARALIKRHLKKGHTVWHPINFERWKEVDGNIDIVSYESESINYKTLMGGYSSGNENRL